MFSVAYAMGGAGGAEGGGGFGAFVPLIIMFVIFYFLLIRPQQKKNKDHREMISNLRKGDRVVTGGGIHGRITGVSDTTLTVEIADRVRVKVNRGNVSAMLNTPAKPQPKKGGKADAKKLDSKKPDSKKPDSKK